MKSTTAIRPYAARPTESLLASVRVFRERDMPIPTDLEAALHARGQSTFA